MLESLSQRVIRKWLRGTDERGLTDEQRSEFYQDLLSYIFDELMPWHSKLQLRDFSQTGNLLLWLMFKMIDHTLLQEPEMCLRIHTRNSLSSTC